MANSNEPDIKMIVGLGNPGTQYDHTRHNMGVDLLNIIADKYRINMQLESRYFGIVGRGEIEGNEVRLVYPTTYMNESGRCVGAIANFFKIKPEEILVIHDDLDLLPGHMRLKFGGGLAGHNGLKSITSCLGNNQNFYRLRIGIGKPPSHDVVSWVLGRPALNDRENIDAAMQEALKGVRMLFTQGLSRATALINGFKPTLEE